ncbi:MAG: ABC transporter substrate-binding protein [Clostridia bacterium]|nr:ABC transporter substrate-binding protein [Clostridia bacterium]
MKRTLAILLLVLVCAASVSAEGSARLTIAYQYGLAYAPVVVAMQQGLIEKAYADAAGGELEIEWVQMSSGADINTGVMSGSVDVGFMGVGPALTGISKNVGYRIFSSLSGQEHGLMSSDPEIKSLSDIIGSGSQIALVNIGSIQHIILARALSLNGSDPHALDANLVAMKHPDGMNALLTGSLPLHLTTNPYIYRERETEGLYEIEELKSAWPKENSFIVGVAAIEMHDSEPELYAALCSGLSAAIEYVNGNIEATAELTSQYDGNAVEDEIRYLQMGNYSAETRGVEEMAAFMFENGFIEADPGSYADLVFDNVKGN